MVAAGIGAAAPYALAAGEWASAQNADVFVVSIAKLLSSEAREKHFLLCKMETISSLLLIDYKVTSCNGHWKCGPASFEHRADRAGTSITRSLWGSPVNLAAELSL